MAMFLRLRAVFFTACSRAAARRKTGCLLVILLAVSITSTYEARGYTLLLVEARTAEPRMLRTTNEDF